jgi:microcystin-dependent protein
MDPFIAEIRIYGFNFAPVGWAFCNGQLLSISQNTALFSILGTFYGGNGTTNFALPDMQGNVPVDAGQGPGLSLYDLGQTGGSEAVTLLTTEMPSHTHSLGAQNVPLGSSANPLGNTFDRPASGNLFNVANPAPAAMSPFAVTVSGQTLPHNNMQPYLALNFCIALQGVFPPRH